MRNGNITKTGIFLLLVAGLPLAVAADADEWVAVGSQPSAAETAPPKPGSRQRPHPKLCARCSMTPPQRPPSLNSATTMRAPSSRSSQ